MHKVALVGQTQTDRGVFEVGDQAIPLGHARLSVPIHLHSGPPLIILLDHSTLGEDLQPCQAVVKGQLLSIPTAILIQRCHPYTGNLNSETPGDSENAFLHWGDVHEQSQDCALRGVAC